MKLKNNLLILLILIFSSSCGVKKDVSNHSLILFAKIKNDKIIILKNTDSLIKLIENNITTKKQLQFNQVSVKRQKTISADKKEFYYVFIHDSINHIKISRWLEKKGKNLYFNNDDAFKLTYNFCIGEDDCDPNLFYMDNEYFWSCKLDPKCLITPVDSTQIKCKFTKLVIF